MLYKNGSTWDPLPNASPVSTGQMSIVTTFETKIIRANGLPFNPTYDLLNTTDNIYELPAETDSYGSYMYPNPPTASHYVSQRVFLNVGDSIVTNLTNFITYGWSDGSSTFWPYRYDADPQAHEEDWRDVMVNLIATARTEETNIVIKADNIITENMMMNLNMILHDNVLQSDFVKSVITMFNLYLEQSSPTNYIIEPRDDFYNTYTEIQDLTDKVDFDTYSAERPQVILGTDLTFTYDEDSDTFNDEYKKCTEKIYGQYEKKSPVGIDEKEIKIVFAPTPSGALTEMKDTLGRSHFDVPKIFRVSDDNQYVTDATFKPRILYWNGWTSTLFTTDGWVMYGCNGRRVETNGLYEGQFGYNFANAVYIGKHPYVGHFNLPFGNETIDLNFGACDWYWSYFPVNVWATNANLYNTYYSNIINELTANDARMVTFNAVLSSKDILDIKFYNPICIDGIYYRLYQIEDFVPGKECTIRLLKSLYIQDQFVEKLPRPVIPIFIGNLTHPSINNSVLDIINGGTISIAPAAAIKKIHLPVDLYDPNMTRGSMSTVTSYDVIDGNDEYTINGYLYDKLVLFAEKEDRNNVKVDLFDPNYSESLTVDEMLNGKKESSMERLKKI